MKRRNIICLTLVLALVLAACAGCGANKDAAKVGTEEIKVLYLENLYRSNADYASLYGYSLDTAEGVEAYQDYLLDSLIAAEVRAYKAREAGLVLTEEELAQAQEAADKAFSDFYKGFVDSATNAGASDVNAYANQLLTDTLTSNRTTLRKLQADFLDTEKSDLLVAKHREQILAEVAPTAEELKAAYDEELASQQEAFDETPSGYFTYETYYGYGYSAMPLYIPEGFFYVRNILVSDEEKAKELKARIDAGEDFETLLAEYNEDPGMDGEAYAEGYIIGEGAGFDAAFLEAALALAAEGDVSEPVKSSYGYHIIKRLGDVPAGPIDYAEVQEDFDSYTTTLLKEQHYAALLEGWMAEDIVSRYPDNYRHIGKSALEG